MVNEKLDRSGLSAFEESLVHDLTTQNRHFIHEGTPSCVAMWLRSPSAGSVKIRNGDKVYDIHVILLSDLLLLTQVKDDSRLSLKVSC